MEIVTNGLSTTRDAQGFLFLFHICCFHGRTSMIQSRSSMHAVILLKNRYTEEILFQGYNKCKESCTCRFPYMCAHGRGVVRAKFKVETTINWRVSYQVTAKKCFPYLPDSSLDFVKNERQIQVEMPSLLPWCSVQGLP